MELTMVERWAQLFGVPVAVLFVMAVALYRSARWCAPRVDKLVHGHLTFLQKTSDSLEQTKATVMETHDRVKDIHRTVVR